MRGSEVISDGSGLRRSVSQLSDPEKIVLPVLITACAVFGGLYTRVNLSVLTHHILFL